MIALQTLLPRLDGVRQTGPDTYMSRCPGHEDKSPSFSIKQVDDRLLIHCFAGCGTADVLAALGLSLSDLFERPLSHHRSPLSAYERRRMGQSADALKALHQEAEILLLAACDLAIKHEEWERMVLACERIHAAMKVVA